MVVGREVGEGEEGGMEEELGLVSKIKKLNKRRTILKYAVHNLMFSILSLVANKKEVLTRSLQL